MLFAYYNFFFILLMCLLVILPKILMSVYVYRDSVNQGRDNAVLWIILLVLVPFYIGFIVYLLFGRNHKYVKCRNCGARMPYGSRFCNKCGNENLSSEPEPVYSNNNRLVVIAIVLIVLEYIVPAVIFGFNFMRFNNMRNYDSVIHSMDAIDDIKTIKFKNDSQKYTFSTDINKVGRINVNPSIKKGNAYILVYDNGNKKAEFKMDKDTEEFNIYIDDYKNKADDGSLNAENLYFILQTEEASGKVEISEHRDSGYVFKDSTKKYSFSADADKTQEIRINSTIKKGEAKLCIYIRGNLVSEYELANGEIIINMNEFKDKFSEEGKKVDFVIETKDATGKVNVWKDNDYDSIDEKLNNNSEKI